MSGLLVLYALLPSNAFAADVNGDGCEDAFFAANSACVAPTAALGVGVTVGAGAVIGERATIGADSEIGANVIVGRGAVVGERTVLGVDSVVSRSATIGADVDASVGGLSVGYAASLGDRCAISENVTVGSLVAVGVDCDLGANTVIARSVQLGDGAVLGAGVVIGPTVTAGLGFAVGSGARLRKASTFGNGVTIGSGVAIGRDSTLGHGTSIGVGATLRSMVQVFDGGAVADGAFVPRGTVIDGGPIDGCTASFGVSCPELELDYLKASDSQLAQYLGQSVSLSGDRMAVGASGSNGGVYVFSRSAGVWSQQARLTANPALTGDHFGHSVSLDGDTLVIGAPFEDSNATGVNADQSDNSLSQSGAAFVFTFSGGVWTEQAYLKASQVGGNDQFGQSVTLSGDTLAVGADGEDSAATGVNGNDSSNATAGSGAVYVFSRSGSVWSQQAYLKASNTGQNDTFGYAVSLEGDTLAVSAIVEASAATGINGNQGSNAATSSGAVYVFTRSGSVWSQQAYLKASNAGAGDSFGTGLALSGETLAVGAGWEDSAATGVGGNQGSNGAENSGAVYVFTRDGSVWSQEAYIKASNTNANDRFGTSVALFGNTLAVGASFEDGAGAGVDADQASNAADRSGAAYVFTRSQGVWSQDAYIKATNPDPIDFLGSSVALSGDTLAIGAPAEDSTATGVNGDQSLNDTQSSGAVYVTRAP